MNLIGKIAPYLVIILWGGCIFLAGIQSKTAPNPYNGFLWITLGYVFWSLCIIVATGGKALSGFELNTVNIALALVYGLGGVALVIAVQHNSITKVSGLSALYPLVAFFLAVMWNGEPITMKKTLGIIFAIIAGFLFV